ERHLGHAPIMGRVLDDLRGLGMLTERLDRNAGDQSRPAYGLGGRLGSIGTIVVVDKVHRSYPKRDVSKKARRQHAGARGSIEHEAHRAAELSGLSAADPIYGLHAPEEHRLSVR